MVSVVYLLLGAFAAASASLLFLHPGPLHSETASRGRVKGPAKIETCAEEQKNIDDTKKYLDSRLFEESSEHQ